MHYRVLGVQVSGNSVEGPRGGQQTQNDHDDRDKRSRRQITNVEATQLDCGRRGHEL
ncbi:MAG TPA: hypothetical protein VFB50_12705 [Chloroflexota bacterium]|nr:hypothetical protein [Chloroflexota bacterium]